MVVPYLKLTIFRSHFSVESYSSFAVINNLSCNMYVVCKLYSCVNFTYSFAEDMTKTTYCDITLTEESFQAFAYAVKNHYWYQMYIDDLPIWGRF